MSPTNPPEALLAAFRSGRRFLITSHVNPDGDSVGTSLGLRRLLETSGRRAWIWHRDPPPALYASLPGSAQLHVGEAPPAGLPESLDLVVALECPSLERSGLEPQLARLAARAPLATANIDHHRGNLGYGDLRWIEEGAPAVGQMIFRLARALRFALDRDAANLLYLALATDTGGFRFANSTPEAFHSAAEMVAAGAEPETVSRWLHENRPASSIRLLGEMLSTLSFHLDGRIATVRLEQPMFDRAGAGAGDAEGLIDVPRSIAGVEAVALVRELRPGQHKISLRSRGEVDVEAIARRHGGGGHRNAAGATLEGAAPALLSLLVDELKRALEAPKA